jgi:hypothetical protein
MASVGGTPATGRKFIGPASDYVELEDANGKLTAVVVHDGYESHAGFQRSLKPVLPFLQRPTIQGVIPLETVVSKPLAFVYRTGPVWSVGEIVRTLADMGQTGGVRAGLELCYLAGQILTDAADMGPGQGVYSHGSLDPWRMLVQPGGKVQLLGYGLPQVEILYFIEDETLLPHEDSFRYCPPERLEGRPEDVTSDLFTLALVAFELMTGRPVYDGLVSDIRQQAVRAEGGRRMYQMRDQLPEGVRDVLSRAMKFDPDARYRDGMEFVYAVHDLLGAPDHDGPSLNDILQRVRQARKPGQVVVGGQTGVLSRDELAALRDDLDEADGAPLAPPSRPRPDPNAVPVEPAAPQRWGRVLRRGEEPVRAPSAPASVVATPSLPPVASPPPAPAPPPVRRLEPGEEPRRILRRSDADGPRRIRRVDDAEPTAEVPLPPPVVSAPPPVECSPPPPPPREELEPEIEVPPPMPAPTPVIALPAPPVVAAPPVVVAPPPVAAPLSPRGADELIYVQLSVDGGPPQRTRLKTSELLADAAHRLIDVYAAAPMDLSGTCTGWYRIAQGSSVRSGDALVAELDPAQLVELRFVPNRIVRATVRVEHGAHPAQFQAPVGTAVPVRSLIGCLQRWLTLPDGGWTLWANGRALGPLHILEDVEPGEALDLVLRR